MTKKWFIEFRSGRPIEVATPETVEKIRDIALNFESTRDRRRHMQITRLSNFDFK